MPKNIYPFPLREGERQQLRDDVTHGQKSARAITRARILLVADEQRADDEICDV